MSDMIQRYEEEAEAFYQATGVMAPGKDVSAAMHGYDADELRHKLWRMWARAVRAERILAALPEARILAALSLALEAEGEREVGEGEIPALLREAADEIESMVRHEYGWPDVHPARQRKYERDMDIVTRLRAAAERQAAA